MILSVSPRQGFTLLEMSIVIVVIGLIAAGIVVGQEMVHASEIRSILTDINRFKAAIGTFKEKYAGMPGDIMNATQYWGSAGGTGAGTDTSCTTAQTLTSTATCNGDGDGNIGNSDVNDYQTNTQEWFLAWKHLSNAGLVAGSFNGQTGSASNRNSIPGQNIPASRFTGVGYTLANMSMITNVSNGWFTGTYNHIFIVGQSTSVETFNPFLTVEDTSQIDSKIDDGLPGTGNLRTYNSNIMPCATSTVASTAQYNFSDTGIDCSLQFITEY